MLLYWRLFDMNDWSVIFTTDFRPETQWLKSLGDVN
jgi:hypothetical protein